MPGPPVPKRVLMAAPDPSCLISGFRLFPEAGVPQRHRSHFRPTPHAACSAKFVVPVTLPLVRFSSVIARLCA
jgi:hypothetical protein